MSERLPEEPVGDRDVGGSSAGSLGQKGGCSGSNSSGNAGSVMSVPAGSSSNSGSSSGSSNPAPVGKYAGKPVDKLVNEPVDKLVNKPAEAPSSKGRSNVAKPPTPEVENRRRQDSVKDCPDSLHYQKPPKEGISARLGNKHRHVKQNNPEPGGRSPLSVPQLAKQKTRPS